MAKILEENNNYETANGKRQILLREDLEYSAKKLFTYGTIALGSALVYGTFVYIVVSYLREKKE